LFGSIVSLGFLSSVNGQGFINLGFESAKVVVDTNQVNSLWPCFSTNAFPGWTCYVDGNPQTHITYNDMPMESAAVTLQGTNSPIGIFPVQGKFAVYLKGGTHWSSNGTNPAIGQIGIVPANAQSISYWGEIGVLLQVTFNGQMLAFNPVSTSGNYSYLVADISNYAGQSGQLLFSGWGFIDNIQFFSSPAPEPTSLTLFGCAMMAFYLRRCLR
jgi:hypothetical protein